MMNPVLSVCEDPGRIARLNRELHDYHAEMYPREFKPWNFDALLPEFTNLLTRKDVSCYVLTLDNKDVGYLLGWPQIRQENAFQFGKRVWYVDQIYVQKEFRQKGWSKVLLEKAEEAARTTGCDTLEIHHWSDNELAEQAFKRSGFKPFNRKLWKPIL